MQKLARIEPTQSQPEPMYVDFIMNPNPLTLPLISSRPAISQAMQSRSVLLKNMFDPEE